MTVKRINESYLNATHKVDETQRLWLIQSDKHPWIKILKNYESEIVKNIIELTSILRWNIDIISKFMAI